MKNTSPLVSVILPVYNAEKYVAQSIESVLNQTCKNFELIIINDGSTDGTTEILQNYSKQKKIKIVSNKKNLGITKSLNRGIMVSKGKYIARIDADDWWETGKLKKQVEFLSKHDEVGVLGTNYTTINVRSKAKQVVKMPKVHGEIIKVIYKQTPFAHSTVVFNKKLIDKYGGYDENFMCAQDYELWLRLLLHTKGYNLQFNLCTRRIYNNSIAHKKWKQQQINIIKAMINYYPKYSFSKTKYLEICKRSLTLLIPSFFKDVKLYLLRN